MITVAVFAILALVVAGAFVYMFVDLENRLYGNMFAAGFAAVLSVLLSHWQFTDSVGRPETYIAESMEVYRYVNDTTIANITTSNTIATEWVSASDPVLGYLFMLVALFFAFMFGYFIFEILMTPDRGDGDEEEEDLL